MGQQFIEKHINKELEITGSMRYLVLHIMWMRTELTHLLFLGWLASA